LRSARPIAPQPTMPTDFIMNLLSVVIEHSDYREDVHFCQPTHDCDRALL
jgi:hypothetical protein